MADFRLCSTCRSYSQASLYHYALQLISDQLELTFARLRYSLGGNRPVKLPSIQCRYHLGGKKKESGISRFTMYPTYPTHFIFISTVNL